MLAYCGINCAECKAYKGTIQTDEGLLKQAAGAYWDGRYDPQEWVCLGCTPADQPFLAKYCATCSIRECAAAKGVPNCAACVEYDSCARLKEFLAGESPVLGQRMDWLRQRYLALHAPSAD
jgi:hypothetical protein